MSELILMGGGSCSGKTTLALELKKALGDKSVLISTDNFYNGVDVGGSEFAQKFNFDHPDAIDFDLLCNSIGELLAGDATKIPDYDFTTHSRVDEAIRVESADIIVLEGIFALHCKSLLEMSKLSVYVDCGIDVMIRRRIERDVRERGRTIKDVVVQFLDTVLPMYYEYVEPTKEAANIVVDGRKPVDEMLNSVVGFGLD